MTSETSPVPADRPNSSYSIPAKRRRFPIISILTACGIIAIFVSVMLSNMCRSTEAANRVRCASNMRQIGLAAIMWASMHGGQFPPDIDAIFEHGDLSPEVFVCPTTSDTPPAGPTTQAALESLHQPGHLSYIYIGKGLTVNSPADTVVLYEAPGNHARGDMSVSSPFQSRSKTEGMNVLCADGHCEWLSTPEAEGILKQVVEGVFPVKLSTASPGKTASNP